MTISELIAKLETLRADYGELNVEVRNSAGGCDDAETLLVMHCQNPQSNQNMAVLIDA